MKKLICYSHVFSLPKFLPCLAKISETVFWTVMQISVFVLGEIIAAVILENLKLFWHFFPVLWSLQFHFFGKLAEFIVLVSPIFASPSGHICKTAVVSQTSASFLISFYCWQKFLDFDHEEGVCETRVSDHSPRSRMINCLQLCSLRIGVFLFVKCLWNVFHLNFTGLEITWLQPWAI